MFIVTIECAVIQRCRPVVFLYFSGGTGGIWKGVAALLPQERIHYGKEMKQIDLDNRIATFHDGRMKWDELVIDGSSFEVRPFGMGSCSARFH